MNGNGTVQSAVQVMKAGAHDFVAKPFGVNELKLLLERVAGPSHAEAGESKAVRRDEIEAWDRSRLSVAEQGFPLGVVQLPAEMVSPVENGRSIMWTRLKDFFQSKRPVCMQLRLIGTSGASSRQANSAAHRGRLLQRSRSCR